jgi:sugar lactone lactonase YvrE
MRIDALPGEAARLGECPLWCGRTRRLWWVDVLVPALWEYDPATERSTPHPVAARRLGSIALRAAGGLVLACDDGLHAYDPQTGRQHFLVDPEPDRSGHRKNDGRADPLGGFFVGTLREDDFAPVGALYRVAPDLAVTVEVERLAIPNALAFDPDRGRMYFADTRAYTIWVCDFDGTTGHIGPRRVFATTEPPARPDGACVDADGHLWNAEYAGGRLVRYAPSGAVSGVVALPVSHPTCCCFGGDALDRLFVTSAAEPLTAKARRSEPLAGRVLSLDAGMRGRPEFRVLF